MRLILGVMVLLILIRSFDTQATTTHFRQSIQQFIERNHRREDAVNLGTLKIKRMAIEQATRYIETLPNVTDIFSTPEERQALVASVTQMNAIEEQLFTEEQRFGVRLTMKWIVEDTQLRDRTTLQRWQYDYRLWQTYQYWLSYNRHLEKQLEQHLEKISHLHDHSQLNALQLTEGARLNKRYQASLWFEKSLHISDSEQQLHHTTQVLRLDPLYIPAYIQRGYAYTQQALYERSIADYSVVLQLEPKHFVAYHLRGVAYHDKGLYDEALADYGQAIALNPHAIHAYLDRAHTHEVMLSYEQAIADYTHVITLMPWDATAYNKRGHTYGLKGLYNEEIADYTKAIELEPSYVQAYTNRAYAYAQEGQCQRANRDYQKACQIGHRSACASRCSHPYTGLEPSLIR